MGPDHASRTTRTIIDLPCCAEPQVPPLYRRNRWCLWAPGAATESPIIDPGVHAEAAVRYTPTVVTTLLLLVGALIGAGATLLAPSRWFGRVERWAFWRRESVQERVRGRRDLVYLYAGLFAGVAAVLVVWPLPSLLTRHPRVDAAARHTAITNTRTGLVAPLAVLGAGVGLAYTARTYRLSREGHLTDRYTKAVEQLGSDKIEVRLGGIYALERLMRDSPADQPTIVESPCRLHPPTRPAGQSRRGQDSGQPNPALQPGRRRAGRAHRAGSPHRCRRRELHRLDRNVSHWRPARRGEPGRRLSPRGEPGQRLPPGNEPDRYWAQRGEPDRRPSRRGEPDPRPGDPGCADGETVGRGLERRNDQMARGRRRHRGAVVTVLPWTLSTHASRPISRHY